MGRKQPVCAIDWLTQQRVAFLDCQDALWRDIRQTLVKWDAKLCGQRMIKKTLGDDAFRQQRPVGGDPLPSRHIGGQGKCGWRHAMMSEEVDLYRKKVLDRR